MAGDTLRPLAWQPVPIPCRGRCPFGRAAPYGLSRLAKPRPATAAPATRTTPPHGFAAPRRARSSLCSSPEFSRIPFRIPQASPWEILHGLLSEPSAFPTALAVRSGRAAHRMPSARPPPRRTRSSRFAGNAHSSSGRGQPKQGPPAWRPARLAFSADPNLLRLRSLNAPYGSHRAS